MVSFILWEIKLPFRIEENSDSKNKLFMKSLKVQNEPYIS